MNWKLWLANLSIAILIGYGSAHSAASEAQGGVSILLYHRFGSAVADSMTVTTPVFEQHLAWLDEHHYRVIPLRDLIDELRADTLSKESRAVAITVDDGHRSVYTELFPLVRKHRFPITLFIYPSAISNATYALTWQQIAEMAQTGLVDVQSHTYWHPNFRNERARLSDAEYEAFVETQLVRSKHVLESRTGRQVDMLAWPFGIYDPALEAAARKAGYVAAFSLERAPVRPGADLMALPRYLMVEQDRGPRFAAIVEGVSR